MENIQTINQPASDLPNSEEALIVPAPAPKKSKLIFILLAMFVILLVGTGVFFASKFLIKPITPVKQSIVPQVTPTSSSAAEWRVYTNTEWNYAISYPGTYQINKDNNIQTSLRNPASKTEPFIFIYIEKNKTIQDFIEEKSGGIPIPDVTKEDSSLIGNLAAQKVIVNTEGNKTYYLVLNKNRALYVIQYDDTNSLQRRILYTFQFLEPEITSNPIEILVRNPNEGNIAYKFTVAYERKEGDRVVPSKNNWEKENYYTGINIFRGAVKLSIGFPFEGVAETYDKLLNPVVFTNLKFTTEPVYRIKFHENYYSYVTHYEESPGGCKQHSPTPVACSLNNIATKSGGVDITCSDATASTVLECDQIVKSLVITRSDL